MKQARPFWNTLIDVSLLVATAGVLLGPVVLPLWQASVPDEPIWRLTPAPPIIAVEGATTTSGISTTPDKGQDDEDAASHAGRKKHTKKPPKPKHPRHKKEKPVLKGPLDLNTANLTQLELLPGVGPVMATRIVTFRKDHKGFSSVEQLDDVSGIGPKTLEKLRPWVRVASKG